MLLMTRGVLNRFFNPRLGLRKIAKKAVYTHNPIILLKIGENIEKVAKANPRLAQIPIINPR